MRFKTILRWFVLLGLILGGWWLAKLIWFKPFNVNHFFERVFVEILLESPEAVTQLKIPYISDYYKDQLADESNVHYENLRKKLQGNLEILASYDQAKLTPSQQLSTQVLTYFLQHPTIDELDPEFPHHNYPIKQLDGLQTQFPDLMINYHEVIDVEDARAYIDRLSQANKKFSQIIERLRIREEKNIIPPRFVIEAVLVEMREFVEPDYGAHPLITSFEKKMKDAGISEEEIVKFLNLAKLEVEISVYPAYQSLIAYLEQLEAKSTTDDGVWKFPDGGTFYQKILKAHTTTDISPEEVFTLGEQEVVRIEEKMRAILDSIGLNDPAKPLGEIIEVLNNDPTSVYPDTDEGKQACLDYLHEVVEEIEQKIPEWFDLKHQTPVAVKAVPENREEQETFARYHPKALDGSRPGTFFINFRNMDEVVKYGLKTLAYHEAVPGHHLQGSVQLELEGVPNFRKMMPFTAYGEGWGLYAEQLAWEKGMYEGDLYGELGFWQAQMFRAVRLVLDAGIHHKKWTREQAITYMREKTGMTYQDVVTEVGRYIVWPGQACAYKIGQLKILELRANAKKRLGNAFDLREFHNVILQEGPLPLDLLEKQVENYIDNKLANL